MWRTRQAPRFAATMHVSDSSSASEAMPKLVLILKADLQNPLTDKKEQKPKPKPKPRTRNNAYLQKTGAIIDVSG